MCIRAGPAALRERAGACPVRGPPGLDRSRGAASNDERSTAEMARRRQDEERDVQLARELLDDEVAAGVYWSSSSGLAYLRTEPRERLRLEAVERLLQLRGLRWLDLYGPGDEPSPGRRRGWPRYLMRRNERRLIVPATDADLSAAIDATPRTV